MHVVYKVNLDLINYVPVSVKFINVLCMCNKKKLRKQSKVFIIDP